LGYKGRQLKGCEFEKKKAHDEDVLKPRQHAVRNSRRKIFLKTEEQRMKKKTGKGKG
jgi:hypothetical protein